MLTWLLMGLAFGAPEMIPEEDADVVGRTAPAIAGPLLDGGDFTLEAVRGKPVVVSFWASWCGPCRKELPDLSRLAKERADVVFIAVNVDRNRAKAERFLSQVPVTVPIVWDHKSVALGAYQVLSMPTMFVIDRNGTVKHRKVGYGTDAGLAEIEAVLDGLR